LTKRITFINFTINFLACQAFFVYLTFIFLLFGSKNLDEKVHIAIHLIDDLCHEIVYHKHKDLDYDVMINLVIENILNLILKI
jgi:hypothetical protein